MNYYNFFLSHTRVLKIKTELENLGHKTWFDDENMIHDIDGSMAYGIDNCSAIIIFITEKYNKKVNKGAKNPLYIDNCYKECVYAVNSHKLCIPVIFEDCMLNTSLWKNGTLKFYFGNKLYIDGTSDNYNEIAQNIVKLLERTSQRLNDLSSPSSNGNNSPIKKLNICKSPIKLINDKLSKKLPDKLPDRLSSKIQSNKIVQPSRSAPKLPSIIQSNKIVQPSRSAPILPKKIMHDKSCQTNIINKNWFNLFSKILTKLKIK